MAGKKAKGKPREEKPLPEPVASVYGARGSSVDELERIIGSRVFGENRTNRTANAGAHDAWIDPFLAALAQCPNWALAARVAGCAKSTPHDRAKTDPEFAAAAKVAEEEAIGMVEASAFKSAVYGDLKPVYHMGIPVGEVVEYSDKMRELLLKAHLPQKYRERVSVDTTHRSETPALTAEDRQKLVLELLPSLGDYARFLKAKPVIEIPA